MIIAPYTTDAPIYHLPFVTGSLIIANTAIFFATTFQFMRGNIELESLEWLTLQFDTINPIQWITGAFMHGDFMHLIGNMFFLWAFGLVVEGKIGNMRFLVLYMLMAAIDGAAIQLPMFLLGSDSGALGASGVIFALMTIAMLWAPENEMDCFYFVGLYMGTFEVRIVKLAGAFMMLQLLFLFLGGFSMSSEMLHIVGAAIGLVFGVYMLRQKMVDCEGWDFISKNEWLQEYSLLCAPADRSKRKQKEADDYNPIKAALAVASQSSANVDQWDRNPAKKTAKETATPVKPRGRLGLLGGLKAKPVSTIETKPDVTSHPDFNRLSFLLRQAIETSSLMMAQQHFSRLDQLKLATGVPDKLLMNYVRLLAAEKLWTQSLRPLSIVAANEGESANQARIRIAQIQFKVSQNPTAAIQTLNRVTVSPNAMTPENTKLVELRDQLLAQAKASQ